MADGLTIAALLGLVLTGGVAVVLALDLRDAKRKLSSESARADAATADAARARAQKVLADEHRERAVLGYGEVLTHVAELAVHLRANRHDLVAKQLDRFVDDRTGALRRL